MSTRPDFSGLLKATQDLAEAMRSAGRQIGPAMNGVRETVQAIGRNPRARTLITKHAKDARKRIA